MSKKNFDIDSMLVFYSVIPFVILQDALMMKVKEGPTEFVLVGLTFYFCYGMLLFRINILQVEVRERRETFRIRHFPSE